MLNCAGREMLNVLAILRFKDSHTAGLDDHDGTFGFLADLPDSCYDSLSLPARGPFSRYTEDDNTWVGTRRKT